MNRWTAGQILLLILCVCLALTACNQAPATPSTGTDGGGETGGETTGGDTANGGATGGAGDSTGGADQEPMPASLSADVSLDPVQAADESSVQVNDLLYDGLVTLNASGEPVGALAESWLVSEDGLEYTFTLRPGLTFSDGTPIDADAVIANFNRWFDPASPLRGSDTYDAFLTAFGGFKGDAGDDGVSTSLMDGIEKVDTRSVILHLTQPESAVLTHLADVQFSIVSPAALEAQGDGYGTAGSTIAGTGPYTISEWSAERLVLEPNSSYWGEAPTSTIELAIE